MPCLTGDTFLGELPGQKQHLWVVLTSPNERGELAIANFSTAARGWDTSCIVSPGEHPFVSRESCVRYSDARLVECSHIEAAISKGLISRREPVSNALLYRILQGCLVSEDTSPRIAKEVRRSLE